ncbi:ABC transporter permease [Glutamicibacter sp. NPDC087344]|uniref:ABC transporter permease n=1 Tax=Glutamicibacter sp. NPDC087344 TaxID=3363994 RepID=UPI0037F54BD8
MSIVELVIQWFSQATTWSGPESIPIRLAEHLLYSFLALAVAAVIAIPLGLYFGHLRKGEIFVLTTANSIRALPTLGLLTLVVIASGIGILPPLIALVVLAVPPMLVNAFEGVRAVDHTIVDAAKGVGMTSRSILWKVELPVALPLVLLGIRLAAIQVVSAATIAAYVGLGGLGRFIFDGMGRRDFGQVAGGSIIIAIVAIGIEVVFIALAALVTSPGITQRRVLGNLAFSNS